MTHSPGKQTVSGDARIRLRKQLAARYLAGSSLRSCADWSGHSYFLVRTLVLEAGVTLRPRGGNPPRWRSRTSQ